MNAFPFCLPTFLIRFIFQLQGLHGSKHFVRDYLYPVEIDQRRASVKGAIVMDMLLEYDTSIDSQSINDLGVRNNITYFHLLMPFLFFLAL